MMRGNEDSTNHQKHLTSITSNNDPTLLKSASPPKRKNLKKLSLSTAAAQRLGPSIEISNSTKQAPLSAGLHRRMPLKLPALNMGLVRRPSLPVMTGKEPPRTPMDKTFSMIKELQSETGEMGKEMSNIEAYQTGPICVLPPNLWLYSEPTASEVKQFDVVVNVAKEVVNPLTKNATATRSEFETTTKHSSMSPSDDGRGRSADAPIVTIELPGIGANNKGQQFSRPVIPEVYDGIEYIHMPWEHNQALEADLPILTSFIDRKINVTNKRVLVHCQQGVSRSASLVIAYIMKTQSLDVNDAYSFVKSKSSSIGPNMSLIYQLCEWGKTLQRSRGTTMHRRSFEIGGARTAPSDGSFLNAHAGQRKRAISSAESSPMERTKSDQQISTIDSIERMSLSSGEFDSLGVSSASCAARLVSQHDLHKC